MTNRHVDTVIRLYRAVFNDARYAYPELGASFERDFGRLQKLVSDRGLRVVLTDLPKLCKHLDRCLDCGEYVPSRLPCGAPVSRTVVIPKFLGGLYLLVFNHRGQLKENVDVQAISFLRQILNLFKKAKLGCPDENISLAKEEMLSVDCSLPEQSALWKTPGTKPGKVEEALRFSAVLQKTDAGRALLESDPFIGARLDGVFARIATALGPYDPSAWRFKHGPGAISAVRGPANKYFWYSWPQALENFFPFADCGFHNLASWTSGYEGYRRDPALRSTSQTVSYVLREGSWIQTKDPSAVESREGPHSVEEPSRLVDVPKTYDRPRLIAVEPNCHQWCQQNMLHYFYDRSLHSWINCFVQFRDQTQNQELARMASVTGELATLDLSEASDRVTCDVVEAAFRSNLNVLRGLIACRTRFVRVDLASQGVEVLHRLKKFSTMGSAVTFPVESLIFLGCALTACGAHDLESIMGLAGAVSVFGDDIIVPTTARDQLEKILEALCFKVNRDKSFSGANFRESCGCDAFRGVDVTPVYVHHLDPVEPEELVGLVETTNHFYKKWWLNVSAELRRTVRQRFNAPDVHPLSEVLGFHSRVRPPSVPRYRWNRDLQRVETCVAHLRVATERIEPSDDSGILQFFTERPSPHDKWESGTYQRPRLKIKTRWEASDQLYKGWLGWG